MKRYLFLSLLIHTALISLLFIHQHGKGNKAEEGQAGTQSQEGKNIAPKGSPGDKPQDIEIVFKGPPQPVASGVPDCPPEMSYGGIGVMFDYNNTITECPISYPAFLAGVRVGDKVMTTNEIRGEPGTSVTIIIKRGDQLLTFNIIREKICTN